MLTSSLLCIFIHWHIASRIENSAPLFTPSFSNQLIKNKEETDQYVTFETHACRPSMSHHRRREPIRTLAVCTAEFTSSGVTMIRGGGSWRPPNTAAPPSA